MRSTHSMVISIRLPAESGKRLNRMCFSSIILSPPNSNVKMSPHERKDIRVESEGTATSERNSQLC